VKAKEEDAPCKCNYGPLDVMERQLKEILGYGINPENLELDSDEEDAIEKWFPVVYLFYVIYLIRLAGTGMNFKSYVTKLWKETMTDSLEQDLNWEGRVDKRMKRLPDSRKIVVKNMQIAAHKNYVRL